MNVRELLARLNVPAIRYDTGRGGIPELTNIDIAAALAFIPSEFGRELLCSIWWHDGAKLTYRDVRSLLLKSMMREYAERSRVAAIAKLDLHIAECEQASRRQRSMNDLREIERLRGAMERANANQWPGDMELYPKIADAVLHELATPNHCANCRGRGELAAGDLRVVCNVCRGDGIVAVSDRARALKIGRDDAAYRRRWRKVYEWAYLESSAAEREAARALAQALRRTPRAA